MKRVIRPTYPLDLSVGLLLLIFIITFFLSGQIFADPMTALNNGMPVYAGMLMVSCSVIVMVIVLWEEFLFPIRIKPTDTGADFRNHRHKLNIQLLIYCLIPLIFGVVYYVFEVQLVRFIIWAAICILLPLAGKLLSGIKNYNDFLRLTSDEIEFKNNEKTGAFPLKSVTGIMLMRDEGGTLHRIVVSTGDTQVDIDIDEMELEAYYETIDEFIRIHYGDLVSVAGGSPRPRTSR